MAAIKDYIRTEGQLARIQYLPGRTVLKFAGPRLMWAQNFPTPEEAANEVDAQEQLFLIGCERYIAEYAKIGRFGDDVPVQFRLDPPYWTWRLATTDDITETK